MCPGFPFKYANGAFSSCEVIHTLQRLQFSSSPHDPPSFFQLYISASRFRKKKCKTKKTGGAFLSKQKKREKKALCFLDLFNFFLYVRQTGESSSSHPLQGEETAAVRAVSEFRSMTCFCFYSEQQASEKSAKYNFQWQIHNAIKH